MRETFEGGPEQVAGEKPKGSDDAENKLFVVNVLNSYWNEADNARKGGLNPRDYKWNENLDLYWGRYDATMKADWQAKESLPNVAQYVDRFAAAMKDSLLASDRFYSVMDPADDERDIAEGVQRMTDYWLSRVGKNASGTPLSFASVFEDQIKLGAMMAASSVTLWKDDVKGGRVAIETVDPRNVWFDPTYRDLYRIRREEIDRHQLKGMIGAKDAKGMPLYDHEQLSGLIQALEVDAMAERERLTGVGQQISTSRSPIELREYRATVVDNNGCVCDNGLFVVANNRYLLRHEKNPFWHGNDWLTYTPFVNVPLSPYGRSYMEDFGSIAHTFIEMTNMMLDATRTASMKAFVVVPEMLLNPGQLAQGITPNAMFQLDAGYRAEDFAKALDLGHLPPDAYNMWNSLKNELREAASINEIGLGQFAPNSRTSATEVAQASQSSSAMIRSVAQTIETRWLDPTLDLVWKTGIQHARLDDERLAAAFGNPELYRALIENKRELVRRPYTFQARGISSLLTRSQTLNSILQILGVVAQNELLLQEFLKVIDPETLVKQLFTLSNVDIKVLQASERQKLMRAAVAPLQQAQQQAQQAPQQMSPDGQVAPMMQEIAALMQGAV
jgi:hypothetical protein